jgi:hypothetical protein
MRAAAIALAMLFVAGGVAAAAPRKVMVLRADGKIDAAAKTKIDAAVLALAKKIDGEISPADITFSDATAAVGCTGDTMECGTQVLETLAVDELVVVTVEAAPGSEVMITVERVTKIGNREATGRVPAAKPEPALTEHVGSLFGVTAKATTGKTEPVKPPVTDPVAAPSTTKTAITTTTTAPPTTSEPISPWDQLPPDTTTTTTAPPPEPTVTAAPASVVTRPEGGRRTSRLAIAGLAGGGVLMAIGVVLWNAASSKQSEIDKAPTATRDDLLHLKDLESSADAYALWGNVTFFTGVAAAGAGGFLLWRSRSGSSQTSARLVPIAVGDGGGVAVTIGAEP